MAPQKHFTDLKGCGAYTSADAKLLCQDLMAKLCESIKDTHIFISTPLFFFFPPLNPHVSEKLIPYCFSSRSFTPFAAFQEEVLTLLKPRSREKPGRKLSSDIPSFRTDLY